MLKLILGTDWKTNTDKLFGDLTEDVSRKQGGRVLLVPESISHNAERELCKWAGDSASRYAEVLTFSRLPDRLRDVIGCGEAECMDNGGRVVAMAASALQLHNKLKAYAAVETKPEFLIELVQAVDEFKSCCIRPADLLRASRETEGSLAQKLEELSLILETYEGVCRHGKRDPRDRLSWLLEQLEDSNYAAERVFYLDGFTDFTGQQLAIVKHFIEVSELVVVSLNCDKPAADDPAFDKAAETMAILLRLAGELGVEVQIELIERPDTTLDYVHDRLFKGTISEQPELSKYLRLYQADSVTCECDAAATNIQDLVRGGARYRDIRVVCADLAAYHTALKASFTRYGIPMYVAGTEEILDMPIINTVLAALEAATCGFDQKAVMRYLRSYLSPLDMDTCDAVENYAFTWNIRGERWKREWNNHPDGIGKEDSAASREKLRILNTARHSAIAPLVTLEEGFRKAASIKDLVLSIYHFLEEIELDSRLKQIADAVSDDGERAMIQIFNQLWDILLNALEQLYDVLGHSVWDADTFVRLLKLLLSQYHVGTIPTVLDAVSVGAVTAMRHQREKHLIILGAADGSFPRYGKSGGVLTDQERAAVRRMGVPLTGGALDGLQSEFADIYNIFCGAQETVTVSCPAGQPSYIYKRLLSMTGKESSFNMGIGAAESNPYVAGALFARNKDKQSAEKLSLQKQYKALSGAIQYDLGKVSSEGISALYGECLNLSASKIDQIATCRMKYFFEYGIRATERKEATIDPMEFGSYIHDVLENTARKIKEKGGFHNVSLDETLEIAGHFAEVYAQDRFSQVDSERMKYLFERNTQELEVIVTELWEELQNSDFEPFDFELSFGPNGKMDYIYLHGNEMRARLEGKVDRVDTWNSGYQNYFRVVDYKTGKKDFDYCDVFNGIGLQMFLYLFALEENGQELLGEHSVPAGVQYFPARVPIINLDGDATEEAVKAERTNQLKRKGLILHDDAVLRAMEHFDKPVRMQYSRKKDGTASGNLASRDQMKLLKGYLFLLLRNFVDDIASGCVTPNPYTRGNANPCKYCPYGAICHPAYVEGRRNYKAMSANWFWEAIGEEMEKNG